MRNDLNFFAVDIFLHIFLKIGNYVSISQKCPSCEIATHFINIMILGMSNLVDHNGRTIWFEGPAGPMKPSNSKSRTKKTTNKRKNKANEEAEDNQCISGSLVKSENGRSKPSKKISKK